jgi:thiamine biosynthesis protein ThiS
MSDSFKIQLNGQSRTFEEFTTRVELSRLIESLGLKADRIAIERNGEILYRNTWDQISIADGDRLEIVQFVGGGVDPDRCAS